MDDDKPATDPIRDLGHALRNTLSPAMMVAERLGDHADPAVQRASKIILKSLDQAIEAVRVAVANRQASEFRPGSD